ncbi:unnamed protein product [Prunus armeniaca]
MSYTRGAWRDKSEKLKKEGAKELKKKGRRKKMMIKLPWKWVCSIYQAKAITVVHKSAVAQIWTDVGILGHLWALRGNDGQ